MSWLLDRRAFCGALLFVFAAYIIGMSTGCGHGGVPTGSVSKAANNVQPSTGGSTGGSTPGVPTGTTIRLIAYESGLVYEQTQASSIPVGAAGEVWCFVTSNPATGATTGPAFAQPTITLNGTAETPIFAGVLNTTATTPPTTGNNWFVVIQPAAGVVTGVQIRATISGLVSVSSNAVVMTSGAYPAANTGDGGTFTISSPIDAFVTGYVQQPPATPFTFAHTGAVGVASYHVTTLIHDPTPALAVFHAVERTAPGTVTAGNAANVARAYLNDVLPQVNVAAGLNPAPSQLYTFQVIPLNASGWGVGTSIDSSLAQWIWFGVQ